MKNYLIGQQDPCIKDMLQKMDATEQMLDKLLSCASPSFMGGRYITDEELSKRLKLHRRTLQDYRTQGILPYYLICGKVLYKDGLYTTIDIEKTIFEAITLLRGII